MTNYLCRLALLLPLAAMLCAQEYRATLLGIITDQTGAAVPNAQVSVSNVETGVLLAGKSSSEGSYQMPFLVPGSYKITVEASGFKTFARSPIELRVNDRVRVDIRMEVGAAAEQINVTAEAPLLEISSSNRGQVLDSTTVNGLPLNSHNPFTLMGLAAGVQNTGALTFFRPFDNGSDFSINGGRSSTNEFQIDGMPNNVMAGRSLSRSDLGYVPPAEATQEFKIQTNTYDAQYGRTGGGIISLSVKPGTNLYHGSGYEYLRRTSLEANQFSNNANGTPRPPHFIDQWGFELDGPVNLPKVYKGKDRTFFMFAFEHYRESQPQPGQGAVPTAEQRNGDFSKTFTAANRLYTIFDPFTVALNPGFDPTRAVSLTNAQYIRSPFPGNFIPKDRMSPIALRVLQDIPLPNQNGDAITRANNWFAGDVATLNNNNSYITRADHNLSSRMRLYTRWNHNYRDGGRKNPYSWETPARQQTANFRLNDGAVLDAVDTINPLTVLTARIGFTRYFIGSTPTPQDISQLGLPASLSSQLQASNKYPQFKFENYLQTSTDDGDQFSNNAYTANVSLLKISGRHSMKFGGEYRVLQFSSTVKANLSGTYSFTRSITSSNVQVNDPNSGNAIASFLLGTLGSGSVNLNATPYLTWRYPAIFFQDDWQVSPRLTLNYGLRWDLERPPIERYDRQNRGFDFNVKSPLQVPGYDLRGGLLFSGQNGQPREAFNTDKNNWQPRFGVAYKVLQTRPLVFRGGVGRYFLPTTEYGGTLGYSQTTLVQAITDDFRPFRQISNPFPNGLLQPTGSSLGLATQLGDAVAFSDAGRHIPYVWQYSAGFEFEVRNGILVEASYVGSQTRRIQGTRDLNVLSADQLRLGTASLSAAVDNPFFGLLPAATTNGSQAKIARRRLLVPFPQFTNVTENNQTLGESWYHSLQSKVQQRFRYGLSYLVSYTWSKTMEATDYLNGQDSQFSRELVAFDTPHRLVASGLYEFPIGPRKRWFSQGIASHIIGGWQVGWASTFQSGNPINQPDYYVNGDPKLGSGQTLSHWFSTAPSIWVQRPPDTLRTSKLRSSSIRRHTAPQVDLTVSREFRIGERRKFQFRASAFNAMNTPLFDYPNTTPTSPLFGVVPVTQRNLPRSMEFGFRYSF